ncbi:sensor histidine kinase [Caenimonas soli]|uniref:sensor histidine kinase n=1 Tax=Caenimonas soli TaxID=2735555 RepID=UPI00155630D4|nr:ATP-binding protein [Caenimonas soli]NPC55992.1 two-component sensor histidine kinase [Caenimonas soli]
MRKLLSRHGLWFAVWLALTAAGGIALARAELSRQREAFETDARIAHRLLSQRVVQHDAVLATLALLQPAASGDPAEQRLPSLYPQILEVKRRDAATPWGDARLEAAEAASRAQRRATLADADFALGRYRLVLAAQPASFALLMDLRAVVPWSEWPMPVETSPVRLTLDHAGQSFVVQPGHAAATGWQFEFRKHLAADSQPFDVVAARTVGWRDLPWRWMLVWALGAAALLAAIRSFERQRAERRRAEDLLRLGQVARLNTLGELAAGMAHELNQPLTALLANTQAAVRMLDENPPETGAARDAMQQAVQQGRRAAEVVGRLRRAVERPDLAAQLQSVVLQDAVRNAFYLLEPESARRQVVPRLVAEPGPIAVRAEPVALEQIIHNLMMNALQALEQAPVAQRELTITLSAEPSTATLTVSDSGPGITPEVLPRIFEPFFTTREHGLGLGLSLCESLAQKMGGQLQARPRSPRGAEFRLTLPLAAP